MDGMKLLLGYLLVLNVLGFLMMGIDKRRAKKGKWRIPERRLMLCAVFGGSVGALLGMQCFRHKTKHPKFSVGIPVILVLQVVAGGLVWWKWM